MPVAEISIQVSRPIEEVFAFAVDVGQLPEWNGVIEDSWATSADQSAVGATYMVRAKIMGRTMEIPSQVVAYEPGRLYAYQAWGSMPYVSTKFFEETEAGTQVTERIKMESEGRFSRLLDQIKLSVSKRSHQKNLELLKTILEDAGSGVRA
jgi:uncharacterized protein YndB with AHSA1/START domain